MYWFKSLFKKCINLQRVSYIDKVYIVGSCGSKTLAGVCLRVSKEWVMWLTFINRTNRSSAYAVCLGSGISQLGCLRYDWAYEFPDYKKCSTNNLSIDILISNSHGPSMYTLSICLSDSDVGTRVTSGILYTGKRCNLSVFR